MKKLQQTQHISLKLGPEKQLTSQDSVLISNITPLSWMKLPVWPRELACRCLFSIIYLHMFTVAFPSEFTHPYGTVKLFGNHSQSGLLVLWPDVRFSINNLLSVCRILNAVFNGVLLIIYPADRWEQIILTVLRRTCSFSQMLKN